MKATLSAAGPLLVVEGLTVDFWSQEHWVNVVNRVSFTVRPGEALGLVGESGCGKTTTAYTLLGYRRPNSRISQGQVHFAGRDLLKLSTAELQRVRGKQISLVPQNPATSLSPGMRIGGQIGEVMRAHGVRATPDERRQRILDLLASMNLPEPESVARKYPHQLSGGQQQRVVIAMALACDPALLVLDEPTTALDVTTQAQILELLVRLRAERGMAMVYVTHNLGVLAKISDRISVMYAGELVEDAPTRELFRNPRHPYTRGLIASLPSLVAPRRGRTTLLRGILQRDNLPAGCRFAPRCDFAEAINFDEPQHLKEIAPGHRVACRRMHEIPALVARQAPQVEPPPSPSAPTGEPLLTIRQLDTAYEFTRARLFAPRVPKLIIKNVAFDIRPRETFALVGESGSGKSTIARAVAGLVKPTAGSLVFDGHDISLPVDARSHELRREIQLVLQNPDASLNPRQRVIEIIGRPLGFFFGYRGPEIRKRVEQLLEDIRLDRSYARRYADELSGGERQRIAIARALAANPKLVLCDEVLSALDVSVQADILDLLRALQSQHQIAYLFISHDLAVVRSIAHRVGVLYRGELVEVGQVEEVYSPPFHPYTHLLLSAVPEVETDFEFSGLVRTETAASIDYQHRGCPFADRCPWKLGPICDSELPPWQFNTETHALRCHIPLADLRGRETVSRRLSATREPEAGAKA